jgi:hypothetical protein
VVFPHTLPDGRLVNLYGRAVGTAEQVPKALRHDHLPGTKGYFNATALHTGAGPLWVCEGACDALALLAAGVPRVVAIFGVQGWRWAWARAVLPAAAYGGCKDVSEAWAAGVLPGDPGSAAATAGLTVPEAPRAPGTPARDPRGPGGRPRPVVAMAPADEVRPSSPQTVGVPSASAVTT